MYSQIVNPITLEKVSTNSPQGQRILNNYINEMRRSRLSTIPRSKNRGIRGIGPMTGGSGRGRGRGRGRGKGGVAPASIGRTVLPEEGALMVDKSNAASDIAALDMGAMEDYNDDRAKERYLQFTEGRCELVNSFRRNSGEDIDPGSKPIYVATIPPGCKDFKIILGVGGVSSTVLNNLHHSNLVPGPSQLKQDVYCAGHMRFDEFGKLSYADNSSGHFLPSPARFRRFISRLFNKYPDCFSLNFTGQSRGEYDVPLDENLQTIIQKAYSDSGKSPKDTLPSTINHLFPTNFFKFNFDSLPLTPPDRLTEYWAQRAEQFADDTTDGGGGAAVALSEDSDMLS